MATYESVDHLQLPITVDSAPIARNFYEQVLGLRKVRNPSLDRPGTLRYALGRQRLDLTESHYIGVRPQAHLVLWLFDLASLRRRLLAAGVLFDDVPLNDRCRLSVEDPFGNRLELIEIAQGSAASVGAFQFAV